MKNKFNNIIIVFILLLSILAINTISIASDNYKINNCRYECKNNTCIRQEDNMFKFNKNCIKRHKNLNKNYKRNRRFKKDNKFYNFKKEYCIYNR